MWLGRVLSGNAELGQHLNAVGACQARRERGNGGWRPLGFQEVLLYRADVAPTAATTITI